MGDLISLGEKLKLKKGFTLIEMILSIAAAGMLFVVLAFSVPFVAKMNEASMSTYRAQVMAGMITNRIEDHFRYADYLDISASLPAELQQGNKYIYVSDGVLYEKSYGASPVEVIQSSGFDGYSCDIVFKAVNDKVAGIVIKIYRNGGKIYERRSEVTALNLGAGSVTGMSEGGCAAFRAGLRENIPVSYISVGSLYDYIDEGGGCLQMTGDVYPQNATSKGLVWSLAESGYALISQDGLLTALKNGIVTVRASAVDGSGATGTKQILISNQNIPVIGLSLSTETGETTLKYGGYTLGIIADVQPDDATNTQMTWSTDNPVYASIDENGVLTSGYTKNKSVIVTATSNDGTGITATIEIRIVP